MRDRLFSIGTSKHYAGGSWGGSGTLTKRNHSGLNVKLLPLFFTRRQCPLWVKSRHVQRTRSCLLYPRKRTCAAALAHVR